MHVLKKCNFRTVNNLQQLKFKSNYIIFIFKIIPRMCLNEKYEVVATVLS